MSIRIRFLAVILLIVMILSVTLFPFQQQVSAARTPQVSKISGQIALFTDGTVWVWGSDPYGSDGSSFEPEGLRIPVQIKELADVIDIARGGGFSVALKKDGTVWVWGSGQFGGLGDGRNMFSENLTFPMEGPKPYSQKPVQVKALSDIVAIAAGGHGLALRKDGTVWGWGQNGAGQIGAGKYAESMMPVTQVTGLPVIQSIATGWFHSLALDTNGEVWMWGENYFGKSGDGTESRLNYNEGGNHEVGMPQNKAVPVKVKQLSDVARIQAVGDWFNIAVKKDDSLWFWGKDNILSFSHGETRNQLLPREVPELHGAPSVVSNYNFSMILRQDGTVWTLGYNKFGQLGVGTKQDNMKPAQVPGLKDVIGISNEDYSAYALKQDGTVWAWGRNDQGQLGNRNRYLFLTPRQVIFNPDTPVMERSIEVILDDVVIPLQAPPKTINGSLYVPAAAIVNQLGYTLTVRNQSTAEIKKGSQILIVENGSKRVKINQKTSQLDKQVIISGREVWLPMNALKLLFDVKSYYEAQNQIIAITTQKK